MTRNTAFICAVVALPLIVSASVPAALIHPDNKMFQDVRAKFQSAVDAKYITNENIYWNPTLITDNPLLTKLCQCNQEGNYQNPSNCNQFIMCGSGQVWLWQCPGNGWYDPFPDCCVYNNPYAADTCPWSSTWKYPDIRCETLGQRPYWSNITFPQYPKVCCGRDIYYCNNFNKVGEGKCPPGCGGYSKAFLGCLDYETCKEADRYFGLE